MTNIPTNSIASAPGQEKALSPAAQTPPTSPIVSAPAETEAHGNATNVDLSPSAKAVLAKSASSSNAASATASGPAAAVVAPAVSTASLIESAKRKVIPQVGVTGANDVVDNKGNISKARLAVEIAEQAKKS